MSSLGLGFRWGELRAFVAEEQRLEAERARIAALPPEFDVWIETCDDEQCDCVTVSLVELTKPEGRVPYGYRIVQEYVPDYEDAKVREREFRRIIGIAQKWGLRFILREAVK